MQSVTPLFIASLRRPYQAYTRVDLHTAGGDLLYGGLPVEDCTVTVDRGSDCRYTCSVTLPDVTLLPREATDLLAPYGARLSLHSGITYPDGSVESVQVGYYRLEEPGADVDAGPVSISGKGLEVALADDKFTAPKSIAATDAATALNNLIGETFAGARVTNGIGTVAVGTRTWDAGGDRWAACKEVATAAGAEIYADALGGFQLRPIPDIDYGVPVWDVTAGDLGVMVKAEWSMSRDGVYNGVLCTGENTADNTAPVSGLVVDDDIASPTYWGGPFGHALYSFTSAAVTTAQQAEGAARAKLRDLKGPNTQLTLGTAPNPALECGDCLRVVYRDGRAELHLIQSISMSLIGGEMSIKTISRKDLVSTDAG